MTEKKALGRGLDALFGENKNTVAPLNTGTSASAPQRKLAIGALMPGKAQPRRLFDGEAIESLALSIKEHGVLQPLLVRPSKDNLGKYEIIAGERRWRAAQKAQIHEVPVVVQDLSDEDAAEIALVENLQRQDLTAIEEAEGYQRLMQEFGHTQEKLAEVIGKSRSHIANMLRLLNLPEKVRHMVHNGEISAGHARALLSAENPEQVALTIVNSKMSVRDIEKLMSADKESKKASRDTPRNKGKNKESFTSSASTIRDSNTMALEKSLTNQLGLKVEIKHSANGTGALVINYQDLDQLDEVLHLLTHRQGL